jgi:hypothetical protein
MIWFLILAVSIVFLILRRFRKESDLDPILWKWFVRSIWLGSIIFFQALEIQRYHEGLTYRPFFGLYAGVLFAFVIWFAARAFGSIEAHGRGAELAATGTHRSPLYWVSGGLVAILLALVLYIAHVHHQSPVPAFLWFAVIAIIVALLFLNRTLKWRYPV